ncbi:MAG: class I SAM-dependent rRNA methyltransferase [Deltaproteobacteria bacterium]|nr:MAG: class I SAM-dependent rRNA methyltransferase [Deltaproteobacteria bacterium]
MTRLTLRRGHDRRVRGGHPWIFSNEIETVDGPGEAGSAVEVVAADGQRLGTGYYNPRSLIAARLLTRRAESIDTPAFFLTALQQAMAYRRAACGDLDTLRLVHGEGDGLPGLVVDRYGDVLSVQLLTAGMDARREAITAALRELLAPRAIVARNDTAMRELEGLPRQVELLHGEAPGPVTAAINGIAFSVDVTGGQKTGLFLDQRENCRRLGGLVRGGEVLDLFSYAGAWSLHAAAYGAAGVTGVDVSAAAVAQAAANARLNGLDPRCRFVAADVFDFLREHRGRRYHTVVLDSPAFIKSRKHLEEGKKGYLTVNRRALELVAPGGCLVTCSCSHHLDRATFLTLIAQAAQQARRSVKLVEMRGQAADHPVLPACPETDYLKCFILYVE